MSTRTWKNWGRNQTARPRRLVAPRSVEEVAAAVRRAGEDGLTVKAVGSGHSFTDAAVTDGVMLSLEHLAGVRAIDPERCLVTVDAGLPLHRLNAVLTQHRLSLTNMGDIDRQTVSGAISTGAHGTGRDSGGLAAQVAGLELVLANGEIVTCDAEQDPDLFAAARVGLGALGVITAVTFRVEPVFLLHAQEAPLSLTQVLADFDELAADNEHFEFHWFPHTDTALTKRNNRVTGPSRPLSAVRHWLEDQFLSNDVYGLLCRAGRAAPRAIPAINRIAGLVLSPREYVDVDVPHRVFTSPRRVRFVEMEYAVPRRAVVSVLRELRTLIDRWHVNMPVAVRLAPADDVWLSTAYGRDTAYVAVRMFERMPHERYFAEVEELMIGYEGRPHWGTLHTRDAAYLAKHYPRFADFLAVRVDPERRFANRYLRQVLGD
ncbi:D-arabinono-1,4-lactone oxidase [Carbonactinospora thermoautotrophica]|uniref:D-arabinono-1,4-lactone oxidase n=1 Tax=Carbonactinospora thermoautotrophica TaxID=1469144 RepID=UPI003DA7E969